MQVNLLAIEDTTNIEKTKDLFYFIFNNRKKDKVCLGVADLIKKIFF